VRLDDRRQALQRNFAFAIPLAFALCAAMPALAQTWPVKPIRMVIPYPAGGSVDLSGRRLVEDLGTELGQPVTVDNRSGANGIIGTEVVAKAAPDGYTFLVSTLSAHAGNPSAVKSLPFNAIDDFAPVTVINSVPQVLVAHPAFLAESIADIVRLAKEKPGQITYASFGTGGMAHLAMVQLELRGGVKMTHVPYKGGAPALADVMGGHVPLYFSGINSVLPHLKTNRLRAIAVTSTARSKALPNVPAVAETYADFEAGVTPAIWLPARTPPEIVARLNAAIVKVINTPRFRQVAERDGEGDPVGNRPEEMAAIVKRDIERYATLMKAGGIKPE
jgi:tripartite-type tricarboxylate transporter receptor subunit TctC